MQIIRRLKTFTLPGFERVPVYEVFEFFIAEVQRDILSVRAKAIAFSFFVAIFPMVIFLFTLIPYIPIPNLQENVMELLSDILPDPSLLGLIEDTVSDLVKKQRGGLLSLGIGLALFFATNGVVGLMDSFNKTHFIYKKRNVFVQRVVAFKLTFLLIGLLLTSIVLVMGGEFIFTYLTDYFGIKNALSRFLFDLIRYVVIIALFFFSISLIYYYGPSVKRKWKFISLGSTVATIMSIGLSLSFSYYLANFANYNKLYGSLATIIILLMWIYLNAFVLLIGFELNASIYYNKSLKRAAEQKLEI